MNALKNTFTSLLGCLAFLLSLSLLGLSVILFARGYLLPWGIITFIASLLILIFNWILFRKKPEEEGKKEEEQKEEEQKEEEQKEEDKKGED